MTRINLDEAYSDWTQESLFNQVVKDNIGDESDYDDKYIKQAKDQFGTFDDFYDLARKLLEMYQNKYMAIIDNINKNINYYVHVDFSSMLQDDLFNGYFDILKLKDGKYTIYMNPTGQVRSNLTKEVY